MSGTAEPARHAHGKIFLDSAEVPLPSLEDQLRALKGHGASGQELAVHVDADHAVNYGVVAKSCPPSIAPASTSSRC